MSESGGHGSMPAAPPSGRVDPDDAPEPVRRAVLLMYVRAIIGALSLVLTLTTLNSLKGTLRRDHPTFTQAQVDASVNVAITSAVVFSLVFLVLYVFLAIKLRRGRNWARVVTFVLTGFGIALGVLGLTGAATGLSKGVGVVNMLIDVAIAVFLVKGGDYFVPRRTARA